MGDVEVACRGVSFADDEQLLSEAQASVKDKIASGVKQEGANLDQLRKTARNSLSNFLWNKTHTRPMVIPVVMEV